MFIVAPTTPTTSGTRVGPRFGDAKPVPPPRRRLLAATFAATFAAAPGLLALPKASAQATPEQQPASILDAVSSSPLAAPGRRVLVPADPPLTESMVRRYTDLMAFLYDLPMGAAQRQKLRDFVVGYWKSGDRPQMKAVLDFLRVEEAFAGRTADERRFARYQIFPELLKEAKKQQKGDPETAWLLSLYAAAHPPLAGGDPPLTREITDACAEAICFMAGEGRGEHIAATPEFKNEVAGAIAGRYAGISPEARKQLAQMPMRWLQLRASWPAYAAADRERLRAQWRSAFGHRGDPPAAARGAMGGGGDELAPLPTTEDLLKTAKISESSAAWSRDRYRQTGEPRMLDQAKRYEADMHRLRRLAALPARERPRINRKVLMALDYDKVPREYREVRSRLDTEERQQLSAALSGRSGAHTGLIGILNTMHSGHVTIMRSMGP